MKKLFIYFAVVAMVITGLSSCKKNLNSDVQANYELTEKFFRLPANIKPEVKRVYDYLKEKNETTQLIEKFAAKEGLAIWDKAKLYTPDKVTYEDDNSSTTQYVYVIIPLVLQDGEYINGFIGGKISATNIQLILFRGADYQSLPFTEIATEIDANDIAKLLISLEEDVFGNNIFRVTDSRLSFQIVRPNGDLATQIFARDYNPSSNIGGPYITMPDGKVIICNGYTPFPNNGCRYSADLFPNDDGTWTQLSEWKLVECPETANIDIKISYLFGGSGSSSDNPPPPPVFGSGGSGGSGSGTVTNVPCQEYAGLLITTNSPCSNNVGLGWVSVEEEANNILVNNVKSTLSLSVSQTVWLKNNIASTKRIWKYLVTSANTNKNNIALEHLNMMMNDIEYYNFVFEYEVQNHDDNVWWQDDAWVSNPLNFSLASSPNGLDPLKNLNQYEKALLPIYPIQAYKIYKNQEYAEAKTKQVMGVNTANDKSDAFRHTFFAAINERDCGSDFFTGASIAAKFGEAREADTPLKFILEKQMDLHNNQEGYAITRNSATTLTNDQIVSLVTLKMNQGNLLYIKNTRPKCDPPKVIPNCDPDFWGANNTQDEATATHGLTSSSYLAPTNQ